MAPNTNAAAPWFNTERVAQPGSVVLTAWRAQHGPEAVRRGLDVQASARVPTVRRAGPRLARRGYAGAEVGNLTASFQSDHISINQELERTWKILVGRSRQLAKNNPYVKKFLRMVQNHVVGPQGFALSVPCLSNSGAIDELDKAVVEKAFAKWSKRGVCDVTTRLSFTQLCRLCVLMLARDGEFIVRRIKQRGINAFGYALQVIDPVLLDHSYRADFPDGRRIRMGVETDTWGKPIAYHFLSDVESAFGYHRTRVPADEVWHAFVQEEPDQVRGVPWIHAAMRRLNDLGGFEDAAIIAARVGATKMGFYIPPADAGDSDASGLADEIIRNQRADGSDDVELVSDATPGTFEKLPPGYSFETFNPDYPHQNFDPFVKALLRGIASGVDVDYPTMANDLAGVNYSSLRGGKLETQDGWLAIQGMFKEWLLEPLSPEWLDMGFVSGQLAPLPVSKFDKYNCFQWQGRRWAWVDPLKDMQAKKLEMDELLTAPSDVMREQGKDPEAVYRQIEKDLDRREKIKKRMAALNPPAPASNASSAGASTSAPKEEAADVQED